MVVQIKSGKRGDGKSFSFNLYLKRSTSLRRRTLQQAHAQGPVDIRGGGGASYERGAPVTGGSASHRRSIINTERAHLGAFGTPLRTES